MLVVDKNYAIAMSELLYFLKGFSDEEVNKIPKKLMKFFKENADQNYKCNFDYNANIEDLHLRDETYGLISMVCYNYWCETPEEKKQYLDLLNESEKEYQKHISEKYNLDKLFVNKRNEHDEKTQLAVVKYDKEKWYKKIIMFLKRLLHK